MLYIEFFMNVRRAAEARLHADADKGVGDPIIHHTHIALGEVGFDRVVGCHSDFVVVNVYVYLVDTGIVF